MFLYNGVALRAQWLKHIFYKKLPFSPIIIVLVIFIKAWQYSGAGHTPVCHTVFADRRVWLAKCVSAINERLRRPAQVTKMTASKLYIISTIIIVYIAKSPYYYVI